MAFSLVFRTDKRLKMIDDTGNEEFEQPDALDTSYLQLLDPNRKEAQDGEQSGAANKDAEGPMNPWEAYEKFTTARGELDVIIDLVTNLEGTRYLDFRILANKPRSINALQELAAESMARFGRRRDALLDVAERLKQGAAALRAAAARDNHFYQQVACLQRFWKVRLNPLVAEYADSPFSVDISLMEGRSGKQADDEKQGGARLGTAPLIPISKDPSGDVCMRIDRQMEQSLQQQQQGAAGQAGSVAIGVRAVHRLLLQLQQRLLWATVSRCLEEEARSGASISNFNYSLGTQVLAAMAKPSASGLLVSLRPLVLEHITMSKLPHATITDPPRPYVSPMHALALLPEIAALISHALFRESLYLHLDSQAHKARSILLHWLPSNRPCTSALHVYLGPGHRLLVLIQDTGVELEGIPAPEGTNSRWAREGGLNITKLEVPHLLHSLLHKTLGSLH